MIENAVQLPAPSRCREMIENSNIFSSFLKTIQYNIRSTKYSRQGWGQFNSEIRIAAHFQFELELVELKMKLELKSLELELELKTGIEFFTAALTS